MQRYSYNQKINPPAPVLEVTFFSPKLWFPRKEWGKIDTGADATFVPKSILDKVGELPKRYCVVEGFDGVPQNRLVYKVDFEVAEERRKREVISSPGKSILLGRDILNQWRLTLDGRKFIFNIE